MKRSTSILGMLALLGAAIASVLATPAGSVAQAAAQKKPPAETWAVVQIGDDMKVISTSQIKSEQKKITDDYNAAMKKYKEDKKKDPDAEKPVKQKFKVLKRNCKTKEEAEDFLQKKQDEADQKAGQKDDSKKDGSTAAKKKSDSN
jgi:hypothetical protein